MPKQRGDRIPIAALKKKLLLLDYHFHERVRRGEFWKRKGGTHRVLLPRSTNIAVLTVRQILRQCGEDEDSIERFIAAADP